MFGRRKEELRLLERLFDGLENSQKNMERMASAFCQIDGNDKEFEGKVSMGNEEMIRAAYALNLCTVSVSQIIDYADENILEQEYETILNNLNLENMPKDEALLNILKQILDTVTFFRIQEGDKSFIEKEYQQKMKDAMWSGIPNFGLIIAGKNPFTMAFSLASQVGIGYMNYRKAKAENTLEYEQKEWQLQRAAIEQLNGLRRELFDAAWRLAERYGFPDEYRLTEKQITQYNKILMDANDIRRYQRLEAVQDYFVAYPPFWYYYGHAANAVARTAIKEGDSDVYAKYGKLAMEHFDKYFQSNQHTLLREDQITSSCALEYIDLLDVVSDKHKIKGLLDCANKMSGRECDVLQLCSIAYMKIGEIESAIELFKYLINENYNAIINAQLLSSIYVSGTIEWNYNGFIADYKMLRKRVPAELLFPFPENNETIDELKKNFISKQQCVLGNKYEYVIANYCEKCLVKFNKAIPVPYQEREYKDDFFTDRCDAREERLNQYKVLFSNKNEASDYLSRLADSDFAFMQLDILNEMVNAIEVIIPGAGEQKLGNIDHLVEDIKEKFKEKEDTISKLLYQINNSFESIDFEKLFNLSFGFFTEQFYKDLVKMVCSHIKELHDMSDFSMEETMLREFCIKQEIPEFRDILNSQRQDYDESAKIREYFPHELLGGEAFERSKMGKLVKKMEKCIDNNVSTIITEEKNSHMYTKWNAKSKDNFKKYFDKRKYYIGNEEFRQKIFAVLVDDSLGSRKGDLVFTVEGVICDKLFSRLLTNPSVVAYGDVKKENSKLSFGKDNYDNKEIDMEALDHLIQNLAEMSSQNSPSNSHNEKFLPSYDEARIEDLKGV